MEKKIVTLSLQRMLCPMPVIETQKAVQTLEKDDEVHVICTDPGAKIDIPSWCRINEHTIVSISESQKPKDDPYGLEEFTIIVKVGATNEEENK